MAFLDNTGLARLWNHIEARFVENVLDNSNFAKLVTYRATFAGLTGSGSGGGATSGTTFKFDRWRSSSGVTEDTTNGALKFATGTNYLEQGFPTGTIKNAVYTVVLTLTNGTKYGGALDVSSSATATLTHGQFTFELKRNHNSTYDRFKITGANTANFLVANVALYKGSFNVLPNYRSRRLTEERANCLRYFRRFESKGCAGVTYSNSVRIQVPIDVAMRTTTPTLIVKTAGTIRQSGKGNITTVTPTIADSAITASEVVFCVYSYSGSGSSLQETALTSNGTGAWTGGLVGLEADFG